MVGAEIVTIAAAESRDPALAVQRATRSVVARIAIFFVGGVYVGALSTMSMIVQYRAPARLRGRLMSVNMIFMGSLYPLGSVIQGAVADRIGLRDTTAAAAGILGAMAVGVRLVHPGFDRHIADQFAEDAPGGGIPASRVWRQWTGPAAPVPSLVAGADD